MAKNSALLVEIEPLLYDSPLLITYLYCARRSRCHELKGKNTTSLKCGPLAPKDMTPATVRPSYLLSFVSKIFVGIIVCSSSCVIISCLCIFSVTFEKSSSVCLASYPCSLRTVLLYYELLYLLISPKWRHQQTKHQMLLNIHYHTKPPEHNESGSVPSGKGK